MSTWAQRGRGGHTVVLAEKSRRWCSLSQLNVDYLLDFRIQISLHLRRESAASYGSLPRCHPGQRRWKNTQKWENFDFFWYIYYQYEYQNYGDGTESPKINQWVTVTISWYWNWYSSVKSLLLYRCKVVFFLSITSSFGELHGHMGGER